MGCVELGWSQGPQKHSWKRASERAGSAILEENYRVLISVSGLEYSTDLRNVGAEPLGLPSSRVVYEAHEYYWGTYSRWPGKILGRLSTRSSTPMNEGEAKNFCNQLGSTCSGVTCTAALQNCTAREGHGLEAAPNGVITHRKELEGGDPYSRFAARLDQWWGYLLRRRKAPVFLSEFGFSHAFEGFTIERQWIDRLSAYILEQGPLADEGGLDWAYWQLSSVQEGGTSRVAGATETFGVLNRCWTAPFAEEHMAAIRRLMAPTTSTRSLVQTV